MGAAVYVVNMDEMAEYISESIKEALNGVELEVDLTPITDVLDENFPKLIELVEGIYDNTKPLEGISKVTGFAVGAEADETVDTIMQLDKDAVITGITFAANNYRELDKFNLYINGESVISNVYLKDSMQEKKFGVVIPIIAGAEVKMEFVNNSIAKTYFVDIDYVEGDE